MNEKIKQGGIKNMQEIDSLRMRRRQLDVEIKRLEDKLYDLKEQRKEKDKRISLLVNAVPTNTNKPDNAFGASLFG
jgi:predicted  nucleic acid-binding Zn-ribbon protein